jgi:hypothetical protein
MSKYSHVFIVTYGRTGSTFLQNILNSLNGWCIRGENCGTLLGIYRSYMASQEARYGYGKWRTGSDKPFYGADNIIPESYREKMVDVFIEEIIRPSREASTIGFKEIRHDPSYLSDNDFVAYCKFLLKLNDSKIIFLTRDVNDVAKSGWWKEMEFSDVEALVVCSNSRYNTVMTMFPERTMMLDYGMDMHPNFNRQKLEKFLGVKFDSRELKKIMDNRLTHLQ